jgi:hypothetical protein
MHSRTAFFYVLLSRGIGSMWSCRLQCHLRRRSSSTSCIDLRFSPCTHTSYSSACYGKLSVTVTHKVGAHRSPYTSHASPQSVQYPVALNLRARTCRTVVVRVCLPSSAQRSPSSLQYRSPLCPRPPFTAGCVSGFSDFSTVESLRTAGVTDNPRPCVRDAAGPPRGFSRG